MHERLSLNYSFSGILQDKQQLSKCVKTLSMPPSSIMKQMKYGTTCE